MDSDASLVCRHCGSQDLEIKESETGRLVYCCISCSRMMESIRGDSPGEEAPSGLGKSGHAPGHRRASDGRR